MNKKSLSLCLIVKNEEENISRCLKSVKGLVDEIIVVDTGSTDRTIELAYELGANVYSFEWINDFSSARNYSFSKATKDYILWLDADDIITEESCNEIKYLLENLNDDVDYIPLTYSLTRDEDNKTTYSLKRNRIVKRSNDFKWIGRIHEYLDVYGTGYYDCIAEVWHCKHGEHTDRNLNIFLEMQRDKVDFSPRDLFYFANELYYNEKYMDAIVKYEEFLDTRQGWIDDMNTAIINLSYCYTAVGDYEKKKKTLFKALEFGSPRSDVCCNIGEVFLGEKNYTSGIFWYKAALLCKPDNTHIGINHESYHTWIPAIQLCVAYSCLGNYSNARIYNELSATYGAPRNLIEHNRNYLKEKIEEGRMDI